MKTFEQFRSEWILNPSKEMIVESEIADAYEKYKEKHQKRELLQAFAAHLNVEYCYSIHLDDDDVEQFLNRLQ
jgi:alanine-alpha-ketoisovalerate/valine-pyruvate aminotransferase